MIKNKFFLNSGQESNFAQERNKNWWNENAMNYDWDKGKLNIDTLSLSNIEEMDNRFFDTAREFAHPNHPHEKFFNRIIDYDFIKDKKVLEIGCGLGSHASIIATNCKTYTGIDITEYASEFTKKRFKLMKIKNGEVFLADAEKLPFKNETFDYVWSWGVIHHSNNTKAIVSEIYRVLKKNGKSTVMVYNKNSIRYYWYGIYQGIFRLKFLKYRSLYDVNMSYTDGYIASHYSPKDAQYLFKDFNIEKIMCCDAGIPSLGFGWHRFSLLFSKLTNKINKNINKKFGWFLLIKVKKD